MHFDYYIKTLSLEVLLKGTICAIPDTDNALDHTHYSRWLSVHIRDMMNTQISWQNSGMGRLWYTRLATSSLPCQLSNVMNRTTLWSKGQEELLD